MAADWYYINGRGHVAAIPGEQLPDSIEDPRTELLSRWVAIDGKDYFVIGVETFATLTYVRGQGFGLLVEGER